MKLTEIRLVRDPGKSFIVYHETLPFSPWHFHPEYELVLILKGSGKRIVGDHIDRFKENDLVFLGSNLPHEWTCNKSYYDSAGIFKGEGIVIHFLHDFLGNKFMEAPENTDLVKFLDLSSQGCKFYGHTKNRLISLIKDLLLLNNSDKLYTLFRIFKTLSQSDEFNLLASPGFNEPFRRRGDELLARAWEYILVNFQKDIKIKDLLEITHMSNTTFCQTFKKTYRMSFKDYLLNVRIGYACRLLLKESMNISEIAYESGFENLSNFNRQFKKIKGVTPREYKRQTINSQGTPDILVANKI